ncbi:FGFR1 oncogene partner 2 [Nymphon striatum]|nr:FGFR1 oncogene partner 2 [Nymphon striatum]
MLKDDLDADVSDDLPGEKSLFSLWWSMSEIKELIKFMQRQQEQTVALSKCLASMYAAVTPGPTTRNMSITVQQLLVDAKKLVGRLKDHDASADGIISQAQNVNKQVDAMKQYEEDIEELNEVARQKPRSLLIQGIQQENRHIRELQQENRELRGALEEHQSAMELIMSKYREHMVGLLQANKTDKSMGKIDASRIEFDFQNLMKIQAEKINEMAVVMNKAAVLDEGEFIKDKRKLSQLYVENKGLRELLNISYTHAVPEISTYPSTTVEKGTQVDENDLECFVGDQEQKFVNRPLETNNNVDDDNEQRFINNNDKNDSFS